MQQVGLLKFVDLSSCRDLSRYTQQLDTRLFCGSEDIYILCWPFLLGARSNIVLDLVFHLGDHFGLM